MIITLTDPDGVKFDLETLLIDEVNGGILTDIVLTTKEHVKCKESASFVMTRIIAAKFKGVEGID